MDASGDLFIADAASGLVYEVTAGSISTVAGGGTATGDNGPATGVQLNNPDGLATDSAGDLFIADSGDGVVCQVNLANGTMTTLAGSYGSYDNSGDGGPASAALLGAPQGLALDSSGDLYIADADDNCVREVSNSLLVTAAAATTSVSLTPPATSPTYGQQFAVTVAVMPARASRPRARCNCSSTANRTALRP